MAASLAQHLSKIRSPLGGEKVYKDECAYCCDTPECETGLYICMTTFLGLGKKHVERHYRKTGNAVYLHMRRIRKEIPKSDDEPERKKPTKLAFGVEGGFDVDDKKYEFEEINAIVVLPEWAEFSVSDPTLPGEIQISAASIIGAESAAKAEELAAMAGTWEGEELIISKHAENLHQVENPPQIPPKGWKCSMCDLTENLWLNLTCGTILCGRKFWDGSGGNNHAVEYYEATKYPLAVKLGTITADGADVYSYDEDCMVRDPYLAKHLAHFGINIASLQKTDKTMTEMEIEYNQRIGEWSLITESGSKLEPIYGPGYTGLRNLGNSCYMNSTMQVIFTIDDFQQKYVQEAERIFDNAPSNTVDNFNVQMAKLGDGLLSGTYSKPPPQVPEDNKEPVIRYQDCVRPQMYRTLVGKGHAEFSTKRQQDAQEYLLHLISLCERNSRGSTNPTDSIKYKVEEKIRCVGSGKVKYTDRDDYILALPIPLEAVTNKAEVETFEAKRKEMEEQKKPIDPKDVVRPLVSLSSCIEAFAQPEIVEDFYSTALQAKSTAEKTTRLATFPDYLIVQMKKFTIGSDWVPKKLDVSVQIPDVIDLSHLKGKGKQPGEEELPESAQQEPEVNIDEGIVAQLTEMGFALEGCKKAVFHTKNAGIEQAMNWVMEHMGDPDFSDPFQPPNAAKKSSSFIPNEEAVMMLLSMGFTRDQAIKALKSTDNNLERAADWIFSHAGELDAPMEVDNEGASGDQQQNYRDGPGKYKLTAFISHIGASTLTGHYVCHILKEGRWVIFNDEVVALSEKPPRDLGYLYLFKRI